MADTGSGGAWFAALAAILSAGAAVVSSIQASRQAKIAANKLKFDLFDKRLEAWEAINNAIEGWVEVNSWLTAREPKDRDEAHRRFWHRRAAMKFLFPGEVDECLDRIERALVNHAVCVVGDDQPAGPGSERTAQVAAIMEQTKGVFLLRNELMIRATPYMEQFERPKPKGRIRWTWDWVWGQT